MENHNKLNVVRITYNAVTRRPLSRLPDTHPTHQSWPRRYPQRHMRRYREGIWAYSPHAVTRYARRLQLGRMLPRWHLE